MTTDIDDNNMRVARIDIPLRRRTFLFLGQMHIASRRCAHSVVGHVETRLSMLDGVVAILQFRNAPKGIVGFL